MRLTKRIMAMALASGMVLSMAACGGGSSTTDTTAATEAATTAAEAETTAADAAETTAAEAEAAVEGKDPAEVKVGISIYQFADNFMTLYREELEKYLTEELGVKKKTSPSWTAKMTRASR